MDWGSFIAYMLILLNIFVLSRRITDIGHRLTDIEANTSFMAYVLAAWAHGKTPEQIAATMSEVNKKVEERLAFAELAEKAKRPWWRRAFTR